MKYLLVFDPNNEQVADVAKVLAENIRRAANEVETVNLAERELDVLAPFDEIVLVGALWWGKLGMRLTKYLAKNQQELLIKPLDMVVMSYLDTTSFQSTVGPQIPQPVLDHAQTYQLGLNVDYATLNPIAKIRWMLTRQTVMHALDPKEIQQIAADIVSR